MTPLGWVFLIVSLTFVWGLMIWSFAKVLLLPREDREVGKDSAHGTTPGGIR